MLKQFLDRVWSGGTSPHDSEIYALVHKELSSGEMDVGLWTKATAVSDGNTEKAKSRYIEMRANALRSERKQFLEFAKQAQHQQIALEKQQAKLENQRAEQEKRNLELQSLMEKEEDIRSELLLRFTSSGAIKAKRMENLRNTLIYIIGSLGSYFLMGPEIVGGVIIIGLVLCVLSFATTERQQKLEADLHAVISRIRYLGGNT